jgi:uncharacterized protein YycO
LCADIAQRGLLSYDVSAGTVMFFPKDFLAEDQIHYVNARGKRTYKQVLGRFDRPSVVNLAAIQPSNDHQGNADPMKKLDANKLRIGDIILTSDPNKVSKKVRQFTNSEISHAMIYIATCSVMDSTDAGVRTTNTQRMFFEDESVVLVMRPTEQLQNNALEQIVHYARSMTGTDYSRAEAAAVVTGKFSKKTRRQFCSRLVAQAYAAAGMKLVPDPDYCSPENLRTSPLLSAIDDVLLPATAEEKAQWEDRLDIPLLMGECTAKVLKVARKKNKEIRSLNDINDHLIERPTDDLYMLDAYESSGYLTVWEKEFAKSPWHYDLDMLRHLALRDPSDAEEMTWYCRITVDGAAEGLRYEINRHRYADLAMVTQLQTFQILANLYERLDTLHKQRVKVARQWLAETS